MPSSHITASLSFCLILTERHGIGRHFGSCIQGSNPTTVFENNKTSSSVLPIGPLTLFTASCPARPERAPKVGNRPNDGRRVKIPVHAAGIRREPPIADPSVTRLTRIFHTRTNISSNTERASTKCNQSRFASRRTTGGQRPVQRVHCSSKYIVDCLGYHHRCRNVGFDIEDCACIPKKLHQRAIIRCRVIHP
jgi:hypothetical protein